uniref:Uncharacterized protein n=1 Tax=Avena sativa TaxID=4498 RepID=A0ACD6AC09_AVESA
MLILNRARHSCAKTSEHSAQKANVVWEPSKDLKHPNLRSLVMIGFEEEDKVAKYIRLVMERATRLKFIMLYGNNCKACDDIDRESTRSQVDEASRQRVRDLLTHGATSSVKIVVY